MSELKYIVIDEINPIIFDAVIDHSAMARAANGPVTSAGFCYLSGNSDDEVDVHCFGESVTLNIKSNPDADQQLIEKRINNY